MMERIGRIKEKIGKLSRLDKKYTLFGATKHRYKANPTSSLEEIYQFEATYKIILPEGYSEFLTEIGNGGVGPYYGLEPLEHVLYNDLDKKCSDTLLNPSLPFLLTEPWNLSFQPSVNEWEDEFEIERRRFDELYFNTELRNGMLAICNYGCGVSLNLVVNGEDYGHIWGDDRVSDGGIYPLYQTVNKQRIDFLYWYEMWLDSSISAITDGKRGA